MPGREPRHRRRSRALLRIGPPADPRRAEDRPDVPAARRVDRRRRGDVEAVGRYQAGREVRARGTIAGADRRGHVIGELGGIEGAVVDPNLVDRAPEVLPVRLVPADPQRVSGRLDRSRMRAVRHVDPVDEEPHDGTVVRRREIRPATNREARTAVHVGDVGVERATAARQQDTSPREDADVTKSNTLPNATPTRAQPMAAVAPPGVDGHRFRGHVARAQRAAT